MIEKRKTAGIGVAFLTVVSALVLLAEAGQTKELAKSHWYAGWVAAVVALTASYILWDRSEWVRGGRRLKKELEEEKSEHAARVRELRTVLATVRERSGPVDRSLRISALSVMDNGEIVAVMNNYSELEIRDLRVVASDPSMSIEVSADHIRGASEFANTGTYEPDGLVLTFDGPHPFPENWEAFISYTAEKPIVVRQKFGLDDRPS